MELTRQMVECMQRSLLYKESCVKCEYNGGKCGTTYEDCITWLEDKKYPPIEQE